METTISEKLYEQGSKMAKYFLEKNLKYKIEKYTYLLLEGLRTENSNTLIHTYLTLCLETQEPSLIKPEHFDQIQTNIMQFLLGFQSQKQ